MATPPQGNEASSVDIGGPVIGATANAILYSNASSNLTTDTTFGYNDTTKLLTVNNATISTSLTLSGLTSTRVHFSGVAGLVSDSANFVYDSAATTLTVGAVKINDTSGVVSSTGTLWMKGGAGSSVIVASTDSAGSVLFYINNAEQWRINTSGNLAAVGDGNTITLGTAADLIFSREAAAVFQMGLDSATPVAQMLKGADGSGSNIAGGSLTISGGRSTGTALPGAIIFQTSTAASGSGSGANALGNILKLTGGANTGVNEHLTYTGPADLALTASTEVIGVDFNSSAIRQWATGALALQREVLIQAPTYSFVGASTLSDAATFAVSGEPVAGTNATITRKWAALFGVPEATIVSPVAGQSAVGIFGATSAALFILRDVTNNIEGKFQAGTGSVFVGANTNHPLTFQVNNSNRWTIDTTLAGGFISSGNYRISHGTSALATNATEGFFHMQSCAGAPSGTPASIPTGQIPWIVDSTNKKLYAYIGGSWLKAQASAVDVVFG